MSNITIVFTDNGDGSTTVTSTAGAPNQTVTTKSVTQATNIALGWIRNAMPLLLQ